MKKVVIAAYRSQTSEQGLLEGQARLVQEQIPEGEPCMQFTPDDHQEHAAFDLGILLIAVGAGFSLNKERALNHIAPNPSRLARDLHTYRDMIKVVVLICTPKVAALLAEYYANELGDDSLERIPLSVEEGDVVVVDIETNAIARIAA